MKKIFSFILAVLLFGTAQAQADTLSISLKDAVALAQSDAPDVQIAGTALSNNYWRYQSFLANYKPQINFGSTLPNLNRSIEAVTQPDGSDVFINRSLMRNSLNISLEQDIALTGGSIFATSSLQRIDLFSTGNNPGSVSYLSTPFAIGFQQPLFAFNGLKWDKRIQPLAYEEAQRGYSEDMENVAYEAAQLFFEVLVAQLNLEAARRDKIDADTLLAISRGRFEVGRIAETELLQIELNGMNADASVAENQLNLQTSAERLRNFLGIQRAVYFQLLPPDELPGFNIDAELALQYARANRSEAIAFQRQLLEAERDVAEARGNSGLEVNLNGYFGLSQTGTQIGDAYVQPLDQEQVRLGLNVPIADWGKARAEMEIARSNQELAQLQVSQERINFEREILIKVQQFSLLRNQVQLAVRAYEVAQKRLEITRKRYRIGKILVTDLNIAISEEANARRAYIAALRTFWLAYYDLRRLALYDFENGRPLLERPDVGN
ncbi:MAG: TolC family protein [Lewinellaceae bacterium]|nr:TolC family protein [Phaeodactylibacter sp.]MCB9349449.1 TolC family protein [Lewinellaceae bacterium]